MIKTISISIARIALLFVIATVATFCISSETIEENRLILLLTSKTVGLASAYLAYKLGKRWKNDLYINKMTQWLEKKVEQ